MGLTVSIEQVFAAVVAFLRIGGILFALPVFGDTPTPVRVRVFLSLAITIVAYPLIPPQYLAGVPSGPVAVVTLVVSELVIGVVLGFIARGIFEGIVMAASIVGFQMGFGTANLLIPDAGAQMNSFTALHRIFMMLIFFGLNLHHVFIQAIVHSFQMIPAVSGIPHESLGHLLIEVTSRIFLISIQLSAPILVGLLFTMAALGLVARTVPQMNVFTMSFPASFFIGLLIYAATFPLFPSWMNQQFNIGQKHLVEAMKAFAN